MDLVLAKMPAEDLYAETGVQPTPISTLYQLTAEKGRRLSKARHLLPVADGFNFLFAGAPRIEKSMASRTQLYNPQTRAWSDRLLSMFSVPRELFPKLVDAGTVLGPLQQKIALDTRLEDARVVASCSNELAAALAGLPVEKGENWGYLRSGNWNTVGTEIDEPIISEQTRGLKYTNEIGYGGRVNFHQNVVGLWVLQECQRVWDKEGRGLEGDMLGHLAGSVTPFECLIDLRDPRFSSPGDMPQKVQNFCRETFQAVPRKPGAVTRCVLESLALFYR